MDSNKDGVWSKGNGRLLTAPEPAFLYKRTNPEEGENPFIIRLKPNWEVTEINVIIED